MQVRECEVSSTQIHTSQVGTAQLHPSRGRPSLGLSPRVPGVDAFVQLFVGGLIRPVRHGGDRTDMSDPIRWGACPNHAAEREQRDSPKHTQGE